MTKKEKTILIVVLILFAFLFIANKKKIGNEIIIGNNGFTEKKTNDINNISGPEKICISSGSIDSRYKYLDEWQQFGTLPYPQCAKIDDLIQKGYKVI